MQGELQIFSLIIIIIIYIYLNDLFAIQNPFINHRSFISVVSSRRFLNQLGPPKRTWSRLEFRTENYFRKSRNSLLLRNWRLSEHWWSFSNGRFIRNTGRLYSNQRTDRSPNCLLVLTDPTLSLVHDFYSVNQLLSTIWLNRSLSNSTIDLDPGKSCGLCLILNDIVYCRVG